jgi:NADPH:quinone reductase-like Zn-dependent oxidoreductase
VPLSDGAGEVVSVGPGVSEWKPGDRVAGIFMQNWVEGPPTAVKYKGALGGDIDGTLREFAVFGEKGLVRIPDYLSYAEAATLPCAAVTAWSALEAAGTRAGDTVLIQGTGGVSIIAMQLARAMGARVLGTSSSDEKLERAKALGLSAGVNYRQQPDWAAWALEQTGGEGVDLVVEVGGAGTFAQSLKAARIGGAVTQIGVLTASSEPLDIRPMLMRQLRISGIYVGSREHFVALNRALEQSRIQPVVDRVYPLADAREAFRAMESGSHFGKLVIEVQP